MLSIIDVLILAQERGLYVYNTDYKRIGEKTVDKGTFKRTNEEPITGINNLIASEDKLNISITSLIKGQVEMDEVEAASVNLPSIIECEKFRTQTIIKNAKINTESLVLLLPDEIASVLVSYKVPLRVLDNRETFKNKLYKRVEIDLTKMDVVSPETEILQVYDILNLVENKNILTAKAKVLKHYVDRINSEKPLETRYMGGGYNESQIAILKENGIDSKGNYVGVDIEKIRDESNFYIAKNFLFQIKGQSTIPSVNEVLKRIDKGQKLNAIQQIMSDELDRYKDTALSIIEEDMTNMNNQINRIKLKLSRERLYRVVNNMGEFDGVDLDAKGNMSYTNEEGTTLLIKIKNEKIYN